jgi:hypothetical protein
VSSTCGKTKKNQHLPERQDKNIKLNNHEEDNHPIAFALLSGICNGTK